MTDIVLKVLLPTDRTKTGTLTLIDPFTGLALFGPVPVLGRAARNIAAAHGNPSGDPLQGYGDTPTGTYDLGSVLPTGDGTSRPIVQYGESGAVVLTPTGGDALTAASNGRTGLLIHAGRAPNSSVVDASALKPTSGCLRMLDWDLGSLIKTIQQQTLLFPGKVTVDVGLEGPAGDIDESVDDVDPPPIDGTPILP